MTRCLRQRATKLTIAIQPGCHMLMLRASSLLKYRSTNAQICLSSLYAVVCSARRCRWWWVVGCDQEDGKRTTNFKKSNSETSSRCKFKVVGWWGGGPVGWGQTVGRSTHDQILSRGERSPAGPSLSSAYACRCSWWDRLRALNFGLGSSIPASLSSLPASRPLRSLTVLGNR